MRRILLLTVLIVLPISVVGATVGTVEDVEAVLIARDVLYGEFDVPMQSKVVPLEGESGRYLLLEYGSSSPVRVVVRYPKRDGDQWIDQAPLLNIRADIPEVERKTVRIDLAMSPLWSPGRDYYQLDMRATAGTEFKVFSLAIEQGGFLSGLIVPLNHLFTEEAWTLASINSLGGYRILGVSLVVIMLVILIIFCIAFLFWEKTNQPLVFMCLLGAAIIFYDGRLALDLVRLTVRDTFLWVEDHTVRGMGSLIRVSEELNVLANSDASYKSYIVLCDEGNDIYEKQMRYHLYPHPVLSPASFMNIAAHSNSLSPPTFLAVIPGGIASYDENGDVRCGDALLTHTEILYKEENVAIARILPEELP